MWPILQPAAGIAHGAMDSTGDLSLLLSSLVVVVFLAASMLVFTTRHHQH